MKILKVHLRPIKSQGRAQLSQFNQILRPA